jgi:hypothetical protein
MVEIRPCSVCHAPLKRDVDYLDHTLTEEHYFCEECNCGYDYWYGTSVVTIDGVEYGRHYTDKTTMADMQEERDAFVRARRRATAEKLADWNLSLRLSTNEKGGD